LDMISSGRRLSRAVCAAASVKLAATNAANKAILVLNGVTIVCVSKTIK
jgi:uncharacterized metal-binding protein